MAHSLPKKVMLRYSDKTGRTQKNPLNGKRSTGFLFYNDKKYRNIQNNWYPEASIVAELKDRLYF